MTETEAIQQAGEYLGALIFSGISLPASIVNPLLGLFSIGSFFLGKRYEKKRQKKLAKKTGFEILELGEEEDKETEETYDDKDTGSLR